MEQEKEVKTDWGFVTEIKKERQLDIEQEATCRAYVVSIGPTANKYLDSHDGTGECEYKVGDLVEIGKYAGRLVQGVFDTEEIYRLVKDIDLHVRYVGQRIEMPEEKALQEALKQEEEV